MSARVVDIMGSMLLTAAATVQPSKPFFSAQVVTASLYQLTGRESFAQRQQFLWEEVWPRSTQRLAPWLQRVPLGCLWGALVWCWLQP